MHRSGSRRLHRQACSDATARDAAEAARNAAEAEARQARADCAVALTQLVQEQAAREAAEAGLAELEQEAAALALRVEDSQQRANRLAAQAASLQRERHQLQRALAAAEADRTALQRTLHATGEELAASHTVAARLEAAAEGLQDQLWRGEEALRRCELQCQGLRQQNAALEEARAQAEAAAAAERADLVRQLHTQEGLRERADIGMHEAAIEAAAARQVESTLRVDMQLLTDRLAAAQHEKEDLRRIQRELEEELAAGVAPHRAAAEQQVAAATAQVHDLQRSLAGEQRRSAELQAELQRRAGAAEVHAAALREAQVGGASLY
ncbi:hypothetical protein C2E21_2182 [Chlorella sorokiniana]|uniref:Uncharacterized protein n=1 Tax=Chlorella sorokiniana TaxID=3076 RepID=A0A2P6TYP6_CHLSO|nr:hypothetical protein C2E21_2182 [Chlorella sorokiniana]|eukprot:PRW59183.1 hypothetical protein C2E21_2182 [Chlorella sorokiniana]